MCTSLLIVIAIIAKGICSLRYDQQLYVREFYNHVVEHSVIRLSLFSLVLSFINVIITFTQFIYTAWYSKRWWVLKPNEDILW